MSATRSDEFRPFTVEVHPHREVVRVTPVGEIDLATVGRLRERIDELISAGFAQLTLDLERVTFMDSTGIRLLLALVHASRQDHWELSVIAIPAPVERVLELSGVLDAVRLAEPSG